VWRGDSLVAVRHRWWWDSAAAESRLRQSAQASRHSAPSAATSPSRLALGLALLAATAAAALLVVVHRRRQTP